MVFSFFRSSKINETNRGHDNANAKGLKRIPRDMLDELETLWDELVPAAERPSKKKNRDLRLIDVPVNKEKLRRVTSLRCVFFAKKLRLSA